MQKKQLMRLSNTSKFHGSPSICTMQILPHIRQIDKLLVRLVGKTLSCRLSNHVRCCFRLGVQDRSTALGIFINNLTRLSNVQMPRNLKDFAMQNTSHHFQYPSSHSAQAGEVNQQKPD
jgi:hypothetical protein